ncbi:MAG: undecaprenyldiphospho-muramoylpentapeptide beta-N-acetylglucosaminyltransferase [Eubacteriaceae bacterium]|jgi:UDP-N-acetylglucosamine--N-acetylmuramyl-(pentapeptide) pyrophosphoryl-undecaprenol N-acetylglucosamine transferase|nr:undecaprenyldiphospho-muramoylpentapeptide beta-N-acetylglucosaminyltransferase [Eubacteriaceae bacterium]
MRVIMTGGGTGGHIYPAIAIADKILEKTHDSEILFIGTLHGLEKDIVPKHGYPIKFVTASGFHRKNMIKNFKTLHDYTGGKSKAAKIMREFKPDIVIGTGGYVSAPVIKAASSLGIPCYIHESNAIPGMTNKMLEGCCEKVFLGFEEAAHYFKKQDKLVVTGNPVRSEFFTVEKDQAREELGIPKDDFVVLAFGGSQGAGRINKAMLELVRNYNGAEGVQVFFGTGKFYYDLIQQEIGDMGIELSSNIHVMEYINNMQYYLSACDLVVSRSGALTVSEINICGKPSILIPSPNVTGDHQTFNAKAVADKGGAIILPEKELSGESLFKAVDDLKNDRAKLEAMAEQSRKTSPADAADIIYYSMLS